MTPKEIDHLNPPYFDEEEDLDLEEKSDLEEILDEDSDDDALIDDDTPEDDTTIYFSEYVGYAKDWDFSSLDEKERERHLEWFKFPVQTHGENRSVPKIPDHLSLFHRWALALAHQLAGDWQGFVQHAEYIVRSQDKDPRLCLDEIHLEWIQGLTMLKRFDQAHQALDLFEKFYPEFHKASERVRALIWIAQGERDKGYKHLNALAREEKHKEIVFAELGEALLALDEPKMALRFFNKGKDYIEDFEEPTLIHRFDEGIQKAKHKILRRYMEQS